jgi:hypothetical protein
MTIATPPGFTLNVGLSRHPTGKACHAFVADMAARSLLPSPSRYTPHNALPRAARLYLIRRARRQVLCWVNRAIRTVKHVSADRTARSRPRTASSPVIAPHLITQCRTRARRRSRLSIARCSATAMGISRPAHAPKTPRARGAVLPAVGACRRASGAAALRPPRGDACRGEQRALLWRLATETPSASETPLTRPAVGSACAWPARLVTTMPRATPSAVGRGYELMCSSASHRPAGPPPGHTIPLALRIIYAWRPRLANR